jgi:hypothetical protein
VTRARHEQTSGRGMCQLDLNDLFEFSTTGALGWSGCRGRLRGQGAVTGRGARCNQPATADRGTPRAHAIETSRVSRTSATRRWSYDLWRRVDGIRSSSETPAGRGKAPPGEEGPWSLSSSRTRDSECRGTEHG